MSEQNKDKDKYKDSVFLPKTDFPMRGGLPQKEPEILSHWDGIDLYARMREKGAGKPKFILHDGPPYANGNIHMGHALNKILKDVVVKSWQMNGYDAPYVPGWDCHGLPIEWKVEEKYRNAGKDKDEVPPLEFREECRQFAQGWVDIQSAQFQRLGVTGDWKLPYLTMRNRAESAIAREIHKFALNGGLYKGLRPVMWSTVEKTALAEAEVEYKEHKSVTIWVKFPIVESCNNALEGASIVIWTTTPWTIPSNQALAFNSDITYWMYEVTEVEEGSMVELGERLVLAYDRAEDVAKAAKVKLERRSEHLIVADEEFAETYCAHPLADSDPYYSKPRPLLNAEFVTDDAGTGFVHIAPGHGEDDFNLVAAHNFKCVMGKGGFSGLLSEREETSERFDAAVGVIEITDNVTDDGKFRPHVGLFAGLEVYTQDGKMGEGNFAVLRELAAVEKLLAKGSIKHDYPHSWRSKAPLIFRTTPQWFIAMDGEGQIRTKALEAIKATTWLPAKGEARITSMIANRPDWCISRQRAWGVPIALFLHKETGEPLHDPAIYEAIQKAFEEEGADAWYKDGVEERFLGDRAGEYKKVTDIVDVWFESGSTHQFVVGDTKTWPCYEGVDKIDLYLEGSDQHRGWFHASLLESVGTRGIAPYKNVLTHGFALDDKGYKMSKSLGNVIDPLKMMEIHGADIIRLWAMTSDYAEDIRIGQDTLKNTGDLYRRIRNTLRFLLGALDGFTPEENIFCHCEESDSSTRQSVDGFAGARNDVSDLPELERYMLHKLSTMDTFVKGAIEKHEYGKLARALYNFCNDDLSAFYFDIRKDRLYCDDPSGFERKACRSVMAKIFECLSAWLAPILVFTAEEAWSYRPEGVFEDADSIHLASFPELPSAWKDDALAEKWGMVKKVRNEVLLELEQMRVEKEITSSLEATLKMKFDGLNHKKEDFEGVDLGEICIVSDYDPNDVTPTKNPNVKVSSGPIVKKAPGTKCERCWKVLPEVTENGDLCNRCADVVKQSKAA